MTIHIHVHAKSKDGSPPSKENVEKFAPQAPASLKSHKMWNKNDYAYFRGKGYSDSEIKKLWDRDSKTGTNPVTWNMDKKSKDTKDDNNLSSAQLSTVQSAIRTVKSDANAVYAPKKGTFAEINQSILDIEYLIEHAKKSIQILNKLQKY
jgi:hypothetical protein